MSRLSTINKTNNQGLNKKVLQKIVQQDAFPLLDIKEITKCLQSCDFAVNEELILKPTSTYIRSLFEQFLDTFVGISAETLQGRIKTIKKNSDKNSVNQDEYQIEKKETQNGQVADRMNIEEEEDLSFALNLILLYKAARDFFQGCGVDDLTLMDIVRPEYSRIRRILSAVVNFARFREEHSAECETLVLESESSLEKLRNIQINNENLANQLKDLKLKIEKEKDGKKNKSTLKQVNSYNLKLENELKKFKKAQELLTLEHVQYKEEKARLIEKLDNLHYLIYETNKELEKTKTYSNINVKVIVQTIFDLKKQIVDQKNVFDDYSKKNENLSLTIESMKIVEFELKGLFRILEDINNDIVKEKDFSNILNENQDYLNLLKSQSNDYSRQIQQLERQMVNMKEKIEKLKIQAEERISKSQKQLISYRNDYTRLVEERNLREEDFNKKKELISEIESKINKKKLDFQMEIRNTELKIARLNAQTRLYLQEVGKKIFSNNVNFENNTN